MPGEDERPPGDAAPVAARLDVVAARLETLGAAIQRSIGETTESTATLSRTVGTVSSDLGRLVGEAVTALGQTRKLVLASDDAVGAVTLAFESIEVRLTEVADALAATVERQARIEEQRPDPDAVAAAVGAEVTRALTAFGEQFAVDLDAVLTELRDERSALGDQLRTIAKSATPSLTDKDVRSQVEAVVGPHVGELRDEVAQLATEVHEDRAVLSRRLAGQRELEELRELVETLAARTDVTELQELMGALQEAVAEAVGRTDVEEVVNELQGGLETVIDAALAAHRPDDAPIERLRTDLLALSDDVATTAKRAGAGQRAVEELRRHIEKDLTLQIERAVAASGGEIKNDTEVLMSELHDDLSLVMRQVVAGNEELEALREAVSELAARAQEAPEATDDAKGEELAPVVRSFGEDVMRAVGDLHEDLALVLKRLAAGQRELDDVREAILESGTPAASPAAVDAGALAGAVSDELAAPLRELGDDLSVLVRSVSGTQEELDALRGAVAELSEAVAAATAQEEEADEVEEVEFEEGPDLVELVDGLRADIDAGLGAAVSDLRDELDSVRRLVTDQPAGVDAEVVRSEVDALLADVRDDLALLAQQLATGQDDEAGFRADVLGSLEGREPAPVEDPAVVAEAVAAEVRADVAALGDELRGQFERLRQIVGRSRPEPALDTSELAADVAASVEPVVGALHEDLAALAAQLDDARAVLEQLAATEAPSQDAGSEVAAVVADLHDDLALVLGQVVTAQQDLQALREDMATGQEDLRAALEVAAAQDDVRALLETLLAGQDDIRSVAGAGGGIDADELQPVLEALGASQDDTRAVLDAVAGAQDEVRVLRDEVAALLEVTPAPAPALDVDHLEVAIADLPAIMAGELRAEVEALADELRAGLSELRALTPGEATTGPDVEHLEVAIADLPTIMAGELRVEVEALAEELRAGLQDLQALAGAPAEPGVDAGELEAVRAEVQALVNDLQSDLGTMIREIVAGQGEVSQLRAEVATVADQVGDSLVGAVTDAVTDAVAAAMPPPPVEDPALAIQSMRADVTAGLADMAADLRADLEGLVAELHEDLGTLMNQVVAGQDDLDTLRVALAELASQGGGTEHVADDLDRLSRDLQALRDRIPGTAEGTTPRRRPRARPQR